MAIALSDFEAAPRHKGDYAEQLSVLHRRLAQAQLALVAHGQRAMIVFEGQAGAGKAGAIRRLTAAWDMRHATVHAIVAPTAEERARHYLARFWAKLPAAGEIAVFDASWYGRVLAERIAGGIDRAQWRRAYDEINEFEAQQKDAGTILVKLYLHIDAAEQERRLRARLAQPWQRSSVGIAALRDLATRPAHLVAAEEMFARTDTRWAPWIVIDAGHPKQARLAALTRIADALEKALPTPPPAPDPAVAAWALAEWGMVVE